MEYTEYRVCERFGIRPREVKQDWEDMDFWTQTKLLAYEEIRQHEEMEILSCQR